MSWSRTKNESNESRTRRAAYARAEAHPKPSEVPTHFGPPRAVRAMPEPSEAPTHFGHPLNLSATCGVRPLPAVSVRDRRCVGRACKNRHEHTRRECTLLDSGLVKPSRTHIQFREISQKNATLLTFTDRKFSKLAQLAQSSVPPRV